jgi:Protein of unknown function (DUF3105)
VNRPRRWLWRSGLLAAVATLIWLIVTGPYQTLVPSVVGSPAPPQRPAPCLPGTAVRILDSPHIPPAQAPFVHYDSLPPTSGPHFAATIATGIYSSPIPDGFTVHALEHGHIDIQYAPNLPADQIADLTRIAKRYGDDVVLAPYPELRAGIALTAWGRIELLDHYDQNSIATFVERLRGRYDHGWTGPDECPANPSR